MPVLRVTAIIDAPTRMVVGLLRESALWVEAMRSCRHRAEASEPLLAVGDELRLRLLPGVRLPLTVAVTRTDAAGWAAGLVSGAIRELELRTTVSPTPAGALVLDEIRWVLPWGPLGRALDVALGRRLVLRLLDAHRSLLIRRAAELAGAEVVVGAAIVRDARLLVARRARPVDLAGRWELPGGQVEPDESDTDALARECREELGVTVTVGERVGPDVPLERRRLLRIHAATLAEGEPRAIDHAELRWLAAAELATLSWLPADRALLPELTALLR